jgi:hypothetical protein
MVQAYGACSSAQRRCRSTGQQHQQSADPLTTAAVPSALHAASTHQMHARRFVSLAAAVSTPPAWQYSIGPACRGSGSGIADLFMRGATAGVAARGQQKQQLRNSRAAMVAVTLSPPHSRCLRPYMCCAVLLLHFSVQSVLPFQQLNSCMSYVCAFKKSVFCFLLIACEFCRLGSSFRQRPVPDHPDDHLAGLHAVLERCVGGKRGAG